MLSNNELTAIFEVSPDGILVVDRRGTIEALNRRAAIMFAWDRNELVGQCIDVLVPAAKRPLHGAQRAGYMLQPRTRPMGSGLALFGLRKDGSQFPVEIALSPWNPESRPQMVICTVRDVTDFERWRVFAAAMVEATEEERGRVTRELHDDIVQRLVFLRHRVSAAHDASGWPGDVDAVDDICLTIDGAIEAVNRICRALMPSELEHFGLEVALRILCREFSAMGFVVRHSIDEVTPALGSAKALALFRIVQESLSNAQTHSGSNEAFLTVGVDADMLVAEIGDTGIGFDPALVGAAGGGVGLRGMVERATMVGGTLDLRSSAGEGTVVRVAVPVGGDTREMGKGR